MDCEVLSVARSVAYPVRVAPLRGWRQRAGAWLLFVGVSLVTGRAVWGQCAEEQKLLASHPVITAEFGWAVATDGDMIVVGSDLDGDGWNRPGAAYLFRLQGREWSEEQKLTADDGASDDGFGQSVAVDGDTVMVGAWGDDDGGSSAGAVYVYHFNGTSWIQQQKLTPDDAAAGDQFGSSVALDGDVAVIGAWWNGDAGFHSGSAYVFRFDGSSWIQEQELIAADAAPGDLMGFSVDIQGDLVVAGADGADTVVQDSGAAYLFRYTGGTWVEEQKLEASDPTVEKEFGVSVSLSGDSILIGAPYDDELGSDAGAVYSFRYQEDGWVEDQKLLASEGAHDDQFGVSVSHDGDAGLVGAYASNDGGSQAGSAYLIRDCGTWAEQQKLIPTDPGAWDFFGWRVAVRGDRGVIGAYGDDEGRVDAGAAYVYSTRALNLDLAPHKAHEGETVTATAYCGNPGDPVMLALLEVNGVPLFSVLLVSEFGPDSRFVIAGPIPNGMAGNSFTLGAYDLSICGGLSESNSVSLIIL